jgi:hypothetical protein
MKQCFLAALPLSTAPMLLCSASPSRQPLVGRGRPSTPPSGLSIHHARTPRPSQQAPPRPLPALPAAAASRVWRCGGQEVERCRQLAGRSLSQGFKKRRRGARKLGIEDWGTADCTESRSEARASPHRTEERQGFLGHWALCPCPLRASLRAENGRRPWELVVDSACAKK